MGGQKLRFYLDEQMPVAIARELRLRGIDTVTVRDLELRGDADENHFKRANEMCRVICAMDEDFTKLAADGEEHAGIIIGTRKDRKGIGIWVKFLVWMQQTYTQDYMRNRVEYLRIV